MAQNNPNHGGGQKPKTQQQCYVCNKQTAGENRCDDCGNLRVVDCPHAACATKGVPNTAKCGVCGEDLSSVKIGGGAKPPTKTNPDKWELEVTPSVVRGQGSVRIQVTKNGIGIPSAIVWVGVKSTLVKCYSDNTIVGGTIQPAAGATEKCDLQADANGLLVLRVDFDGCAKVEMTVAAVGTQADLKRPVILPGPKFQPSGPTAIHFGRRVAQFFQEAGRARNYNKRA